MKKFKSEKEASNHMIGLGFQYLNRGDIKTAMYRFNQAYLLNSENSNIYWGYGAVYMALGKFDLSREQYEAGLKIDKKNEKILIDYGTTYLGEFYNYYQTDKSMANEKFDGKITNGVLIVLYHENLQEIQSKIIKSNGIISKAIFSFPGGRRFHFIDPAGNELAIWSDK